MYDIATDAWTTRPVPGTVFIQSYVDPIVIDNKIMYIDAVNSEMGAANEASKIMIYDTKTDTWSKSIGNALERPIAAVITSGVYAPQKIYALNSDNIQTYDFESNTWTKAISTPTNRLSCGAALVDDILYIIGGATYNGTWYLSGLTPVELTATNEQYVPIGYLNALPHVTTQSLVVAILGITIVTVTTGVVFYFKKEKSWNDKI